MAEDKTKRKKAIGKLILSKKQSLSKCQNKIKKKITTAVLDSWYTKHKEAVQGNRTATRYNSHSFTINSETTINGNGFPTGSPGSFNYRLLRLIVQLNL